MSWNGHPMIDLDAHIVERADRFYRDYLDPGYLEPYQQLCRVRSILTARGSCYTASPIRGRAWPPSAPSWAAASSTCSLPSGPP